MAPPRARPCWPRAPVGRGEGARRQARFDNEDGPRQAGDKPIALAEGVGQGREIPFVFRHHRPSPVDHLLEKAEVARRVDLIASAAQKDHRGRARFEGRPMGLTVAAPRPARDHDDAPLGGAPCEPSGTGQTVGSGVARPDDGKPLAEGGGVAHHVEPLGRMGNGPERFGKGIRFGIDDRARAFEQGARVRAETHGLLGSFASSVVGSII